MSVREITENDLLLECGRISSICFSYPWDWEEAARELEAPPADAGPRNVTLGRFDQEGRLTACLQLPEYQVCCQGQSVPMVGVGGVASLPEYRKGGGIRERFQTALPWMRQRGAVFSSLYPFSHLFYRKFGYELCQASPSYKLPAEALAAFSCTCQVRMLTPGEGLEAELPRLRQVYRAWLGQHSLAADREDRRWKALFGKNPTKERCYAYLLEEDGAPLAYVILTTEDAPAPQGKTGKIRELAFTNPSALTQALGFLYRLAAQYNCFTLSLPKDLPLAALLPESYQLSLSLGEQPMARIINVEKALALKAPGSGEKYTLAVADALLPENSGVFQVTGGAAPAVERLPEGSPADLSLDIGALTQLCLGFLSLDELLFKPGVVLNSNQDLLKKAFPKGAVFLNEFF